MAPYTKEHLKENFKEPSFYYHNARENPLGYSGDSEAILIYELQAGLSKSFLP